MHKEAANHFGKALRALRQRTKTRLATICAAMDWSKSYVMDLETGRSAPPKPEHIRKLCLIMNAPNDEKRLQLSAAVDRSRVELSIRNASKQKAQTATILLKHWGTLDDDVLAKIEKLVEGSSDGRIDDQSTLSN